jgi:hypothetical protein
MGKPVKQIYKEICIKKRKTPVVCLTNGDVFQSAMAAERKTGIWATSILNCCDGKTSQAGKKEWAYV